MDNYPDGMTARDWQHIEGVQDCEEQGHRYKSNGYCRECGEMDYESIMPRELES